jgi:hypothetical protein
VGAIPASVPAVRVLGVPDRTAGGARRAHHPARRLDRDVLAGVAALEERTPRQRPDVRT